MTGVTTHGGARTAIRLTAFALLVTVLTQVLYVGVRASGGEISSNFVWTFEALAFLIIATAALVPLARMTAMPLAFAAIAVSGVLNLLQIGRGLAMFGPLREAGAAAAPVFGAIVASAFFLYFAAKFLLGAAAIMVGGRLLAGGAAAKAIGGLGLLAGSAAVIVNIIAMSQGMEGWFQMAGATGTVATLLLAIALLMVPAERA